jgi:hypothetical protein
MIDTPLHDAAARLSRSSEDVVSLGEEIAVRFQLRVVRGSDPAALKSLETMDEHGAVDFIKDVSPNVDGQVRRDAENVRVERGVMELAERKPVTNGRFTVRMAVGQDVSGFEQLRVLQVADRAAPLVRLEHTFSEPLLV